MSNVKISEWQNYGGLSVEDNSSAEATTDATPRKIAAFDAAMPTSAKATSSTATNDITVTDAGDYLVVGQVSFSGTLSKLFVIEIYKEGVATNLKCLRKLGTGGDEGSASVTGILTLASGDSVSLYHSSTDGGSTFTATDGQLALIRLV
jgi:hypothetical protein